MNPLVESIRKNYETVQEKIYRAAQSAGRKPDSIKIVVVSKLQPVEVIQAAVEAGIRLFGENYPEEGARKIEELKRPGGVEWHMIGHIQSRKVPIVVQNYHYIHSLDSWRLASKLEQKLELVKTKLPVLLEMNVSGEESKQGFPAWNQEVLEGCLEEIQQITTLPNLRMMGLMTMPPYFEAAEQSRPYFKRLVEVRDFLSGCFPALKLEELSMGTTQDYEIAVEEGATFVRIGQAILGERPKKLVNLQSSRE